MRYLNKIVFINSASVKYAEIELNGNVHLTGTQGVGKSTILRAILFFYNANKNKLGIPTAKKRFDDYYFEYQNSYVIYEVKKENVHFCVLAYKINGKVAFRFIDSKYRKELFINEDGHAFASWEKIRSELGKKFHSTKLITGYEEYRRILYGDNKGLPTDFRRYTLVESRQYQNIPRTIQNVLLNSNLEAKFIKDTIIKSISEDEFTIDLSNYSKSHLRGFEEEINDIKRWSEVNRQGRILVRDRAERVIENYRIYNRLEREKLSVARQLGARMRQIETEKPEQEIMLNSQKIILEGITTKINKLVELHRTREQKLASKIDIKKEKLKEAETKKKAYELKGIDDIIKKVAEEDALITEEKSLNNEKTLLTTKFTEITNKYDALITQVKNQTVAFENEQHGKINHIRNQIIEESQAINQRYKKIVDQIKTANNTSKLRAENTLNQLKEKENTVKQNRAELKHQTFFSDEIRQIEKHGSELEKKVSEATLQIKSQKREIETIRKEWNIENEKTEGEFTRNFEKKQEKLDTCQSKIKIIEQKLSEQKTSFYGWLSENVPDWQNNVGKVVDEKVLFNSNLAPRLVEKNTNLFGIELNLNALDSSVKTVQDYQQDVVALNREIQITEEDISALREQKVSRLKLLKLKFRKQLSQCEELLNEAEYSLSQSEKNRKLYAINKEEWTNKAQDHKRQALEYCELKLEELAVQKRAAQQKLEQIVAKIQRDISQKKREEIRTIEQIKLEKNGEIEVLQKLINGKKVESDERLKELSKSQSNELGNKGADTTRLQDIDKLLNEIGIKLIFIKDNRSLVYDFQKDKRELFDLVPQFKSDLKTLEQKQAVQKSDHDEESRRLQVKYENQLQVVKSLELIIKQYDDDLDAYQLFEKSEVFLTVNSALMQFNEAPESNETAFDIIEKIKSGYYAGIKKLNELRHSVNLFVGDFSENNIFKFKVKFNSDSDLHTFAKELKEFIEEDKISEFETRVNERFANIIHQITLETEELLSKEAEIEKIIKKINADFTNKNFVDAIKQMEMRTQPSSNPVVKLLIKIKEFSDENTHNLGDYNLFSLEDRGHKNKQAVEFLRQLVKDIERSKTAAITLSESFELQFRIVENDNDSGWVEKLSNVGSEGTDVLVKAMVNILLLNVFKESASKKFKDFKLHCMMDEIGRLHPNNVRGILRFANERNILLINGSPTSQNATDYKQTYQLSKEQSKNDKTKYITRVTRLIKVVGKVKR